MFDKDLHTLAFVEDAASNRKTGESPFPSGPMSFPPPGVISALRTGGGVDESDHNIGNARSGPFSSFVGSGGEGVPLGFTTATGTSVKIDDNNGNETVSLTHFTGASVVIDSDGSVHIIPRGSKGWNLNSSGGKGTIYAHGDIVMKSESNIFIESGSNLELNVKGDYILNVDGNYISTIKKNKQDHVGKNRTLETVQDRIETIAGENRNTIAGNQRTQVTGTMRYDVGKDYDVRVQQRMEMSAQESAAYQSKADMLIQSLSGTLTVNSNEDTLVQSQKAVRVLGKSNVTIDSTDGGIYQRAESEVLMSSKDAVNIDSDSSITIRSTDIRFDAENSFDARAAASMALNSESVMDIRGDTVNINGATTVDMRGGTIDLNKAGPVSPNGTGSIQTTTPRAAVAPEEFDAPEFPTAREIGDPLDTRIQDPSVPNAQGRSQYYIATYQHEGGPALSPRVQAAYDSNPSRNQGEFVPRPSNFEGAIGANGRPPEENTSIAQQNPLPVPSLSDPYAKLSRFITVEKFFYDMTSNVPRQHILNAMNVCWNIVDPLITAPDLQGQNFIYLAEEGTGYRNYGNPRSDHRSGIAADMQIGSLDDYNHTLSLALYIYNNLPWKRILFERTRKGNYLLHVAVADVGSGAGGEVSSCNNQACSRKEPGLLNEVDFRAFLRGPLS